MLSINACTVEESIILPAGVTTRRGFRFKTGQQRRLTKVAARSGRPAGKMMDSSTGAGVDRQESAICRVRSSSRADSPPRKSTLTVVSNDGKAHRESAVFAVKSGDFLARREGDQALYRWTRASFRICVRLCGCERGAAARAREPASKKK